MPATITLANAALNLVFSQTAWATKPATLYFALFTSNPTISGGGTEVSGNNYARKAVNVNTTNFTDPTPAGTDLFLASGQDIVWPRATGLWGTITGWGFYDAATGGNLLWYEAFDSPFSVNTGMKPTLAAGLAFAFNGSFGDTTEQSVLRHIFRGTAMPALGTLYFALGTGGSSAGLTGEPDIGTNGYARKSETNNATLFPAAASGAKSNGASITFASASGAWGGSPLTHFGIYDAATAGNLVWFGNLASGVSISSGVYDWLAGGLRVGLI